MKRNSTRLIIAMILTAVLILSAAAARPQLSNDEQDLIVEAVVSTLTSDAYKQAIAEEVEQDIVNKLEAAGFLGVAAALKVTLPEQQVTPEPTDLPVETEAAEPAEAAIPAEPTPTRPWDSPADYWEGAVLQDDGTYRGLHARFSQSYAYTVGEDENGITKTFHTEYIPNERFNVDVVFENDGSVVWPAQIEMRHTGNVGEYTGHTESAFIDRTYDPVKPGDKCGFSISAHGSENLGYTTFYFKLFDAVSGTPIEGGDGSFSYLAH